MHKTDTIIIEIKTEMLRVRQSLSLSSPTVINNQ